jgi:nitrous oxide reductase accessory protein NosL
MKKLSIFFLMITLAACGSSSQQQNKTAAPINKNKTVYTCTMHPDVVSNTPGTCPKCGMDLVEKEN